MANKVSAALVFLSSLVVAFPAAAVCPRSDLDLTLGWRRDSLQFNVNAANNAGAAISANYHISDVTSCQAALRGQWAFSGLWYLRGVVAYSWAGDGKTSFISLESPSVTSTGSAKGHNVDLGLILGRAIPIFRCLSIAPIVGWGYSDQHLWTYKMGPDYEFKQIHAGPFVGFDALMRWGPCFELDFGYELHCVSARAKVQYPPYTGLGQVRGHAKANWGNYVWVQGFWQVSRCWHAGLRADATSFISTGHGQVSPISQLPTYQNARPTRISWTSGSLSLLVGRDF